jgi:predicted dehydrogenase
MKKIRVAVLGQGRSGRDIHVQHLLTDTRRYQIVAVVDPMKDRRDRAVQDIGCDAYTSYKPILKRDDVDLVINATPSHLHVPYSLEFLKAGFNVLSEKPLAAKAKDVDKLIAASKKAGKTLAIFQQSRFAPYFRQIRKVTESGILGDIVQVSVQFNGFSRRYDWQTLTEFDGGSLLNTGPHPLDQALQFFGTDAMPKVHCVMRNANSYGDAEDHVNLTLSGEGRPIIHLEVSACTPYAPFIYRVYGTRGGLMGNSGQLEWKYYDPKEAPKIRLKKRPLVNDKGHPSYCTDSLKWHKKTWKVPKSQQNLFATISGGFYTMLYKALVNGAPLEITPQQVRQQIAVIEECHRQNPHIHGKKK